MAFRFFRQILVCTTLLVLGLVFLYFQKRITPDTPFKDQIASNTYFGPVKPIPGNPELVRIEILVRDSPQSNGLQIERVEFDSTDIPLKPRDIYGNRGSASFQVHPGSYELRWVVNKDSFAWPRSIEHVETVNVSPRDLWLQISIEGETASIR